ncbi:MAG: cation:proton antiporter [Pseudomonadota bacterium]
MTEVIEAHLFYEIAALLVLAAGVGFVGLLLRQPLIVSFIVVGVLAGPAGLDIARSEEHIDLLAQLGVAVLLFLVGLKLDLSLVRSMGPVALTTGLGQVAFTAGFGFLIGIALGLDAVTSGYVAVALTFSSTIIIVKLLSDKREIDSLHGQIALGFLIVQDLVVVLAMIVLSAFGAGSTGPESTTVDALKVFAWGGLMLAGVGLFIRYLADPLLNRLARTPELLVSFAVGWAALLAAVGDYLGFGKELGGLLAGVALASTRYRDALAARLASLRDFLLLFFFIALGVSLDLSVLGASVAPAIVLSVFVLVGNPLIVLVIMRAMGYDQRTGFLAGLTVAQISEFSLIFIAMGATLGHVSSEAVGLVTLVGLVTIAASTYMITYSHQLYRWVDPVLRLLQRGAGAGWRGAGDDATEHYDVIVFGLGRYGSAIAASLERDGYRVLGVDFDPVAVRRGRERGLKVRFGDATDPEFLTQLPLAGAAWAVSALQEHARGLTHIDPRRSILHTLHDLGFSGRIAVAAHTDESAEALREAGAHLVLMPYRDAATQAATLIVTSSEPPSSELVDPHGQKELAR